MMTIKLSASSRFWQILRLAGVPVFAAIILTLTLTLLPDQVASAQIVGIHTQFYPVPQVMTLTTSAVGAPLARIQCGAGYSATIYAEGLSNPDGLAFSPADILHVAEEGSGEVSSISANGIVSLVVTGLTNPEGITFDDSGNLYVVEDIKNGRVVKRDTNDVISTLTTGLDSPEGIVWNSTDNQLYVTESNLEYALSVSSTSPSDYRTHVTSISLAGSKIRILTTTAVFTPNGFPPTSIDATFWSYAAITIGSDGLLYFTNELSGHEIDTTVIGIPFHADSTNGIFRADRTPVPSTAVAFTDDQLIAPEGVRFSNGGGFPLYVAEEDTGSGSGRISKVQSNGTHVPFCTGFEKIEDVVLDDNGRLYVSEDSTGYVIQIEYTSSITGGVYLPIILR